MASSRSRAIARACNQADRVVGAAQRELEIDPSGIVARPVIAGADELVARGGSGIGSSTGMTSADEKIARLGVQLVDRRKRHELAGKGEARLAGQERAGKGGADPNPVDRVQSASS